MGIRCLQDLRSEKPRAHSSTSFQANQAITVNLSPRFGELIFSFLFSYYTFPLLGHIYFIKQTLTDDPPQPPCAWPYAISNTDINHFVIGQVVILELYPARTYTFSLAPHILHYVNSSLFSFLF